jgi:hypothetical protein
MRLSQRCPATVGKFVHEAGVFGNCTIYRRDPIVFDPTAFPCRRRNGDRVQMRPRVTEALRSGCGRDKLSGEGTRPSRELPVASCQIPEQPRDLGCYARGVGFNLESSNFKLPPD